MAVPLESNLSQPLVVQEIIRKSKHSWLKNPEVDQLLEHWNDLRLVVSGEAPLQPPGGSLFLFDRKLCRFFRKDGHNWKKKADGKTVKETHEKLKVGNVKKINCYYAHADQDDGLQRRCYWLLDEAREHIVLVHYLNSTTTRVPGANNAGSAAAMGRQRPSSGELGASTAAAPRRSARARQAASAATRPSSEDYEYDAGAGSESHELPGGSASGGLSPAELLGAVPVAASGGYGLEMANGGGMGAASGGDNPRPALLGHVLGSPELAAAVPGGAIPAGSNPWAWFMQQGQQLQLAEQQAQAAAAAAAAEGISLGGGGLLGGGGAGGDGTAMPPASRGLSDPQRSLIRQISLGLSRWSNLEGSALNDFLNDLEPLLNDPQQAQQQAEAAASPRPLTRTRSRGRVLRQQSSGISQLVQQWLEGAGGGGTGGGSGVRAPGSAGGGGAADRTLSRLESFGLGRADSFINTLNQLEGVLSCLPAASQLPNLDLPIDDLDLSLVDGMMAGEGGSAEPSQSRSRSRGGSGSGSGGMSGGGQGGPVANAAARSPQPGQQHASPGPLQRSQTDEFIRRLFRMVSTARGGPAGHEEGEEHRGDHRGEQAGHAGHAVQGGGQAGPMMPPIFPRQQRQQQQAAAAARQQQQQQQQQMQQHRGAAAAAAAAAGAGVGSARANGRAEEAVDFPRAQRSGALSLGGLKRQLDRQESAAGRPAQRLRGPAASGGGSDPPTPRLLRSGSSIGR